MGNLREVDLKNLGIKCFVVLIICVTTAGREMANFINVAVNYRPNIKFVSNILAKNNNFSHYINNNPHVANFISVLSASSIVVVHFFLALSLLALSYCLLFNVRTDNVYRDKICRMIKNYFAIYICIYIFIFGLVFNDIMGAQQAGVDLTSAVVSSITLPLVAIIYL